MRVARVDRRRSVGCVARVRARRRTVEKSYCSLGKRVERTGLASRWKRFRPSDSRRRQGYPNSTEGGGRMDIDRPAAYGGAAEADGIAGSNNPVRRRCQRLCAFTLSKDSGVDVLGTCAKNSALTGWIRRRHNANPMHSCRWQHIHCRRDDPTATLFAKYMRATRQWTLMSATRATNCRQVAANRDADEWRENEGDTGTRFTANDHRVLPR